MNNLLEELLIFGNCENNSVLDDGAGIFKAYENQDEKAHVCNEIFLFFSFSKKFFPGCVGNRVQNGRIRHLIHPISH